MAVAVLLLPRMRGQQPVTFDTARMNVAGIFSVGHSVFEHPDGYLAFSIQTGLDTFGQDLFSTRFDGSGGVLTETSFKTYQADFAGFSSPVQSATSGYYVGMNRFGVIGPLDSLFLYRFNGDGDTLWTRFIAVDTTYTMRGTFVRNNDDVLLTGLHQYPEETYIYHLDSLGNIKGYHGYPGFDGEDVVEGRDGSWYLCGMDNAPPNYGRGVLVRSDTNGTELWRRTLTDAMPGWYKSLVELQDSGVVCLGVGSPYPISVDSPACALAIKYNLSGDQVWRRDFFPALNHNAPSWFHAGYEADDGTLVLTGWRRAGLPDWNKGLITKLTPDGNTIWSRQYTHYPGASYGKDQIFWDVKPTSDGGMVLTGETNSDDYAYAQLWLLKLDSMGCLVPGCGSVGVEEYTDALQPLLRVSPNPASEQVNVVLSLPETGEVEGQARVLLLDASGRTVLEQPVQRNLNQLRATVDVSALPAGLYYLHLRDQKRWLAGSKLVIQ